MAFITAVISMVSPLIPQSQRLFALGALMSEHISVEVQMFTPLEDLWLQVSRLW